MSPWAVSPCASRRVPTAPAPSDHPPEDQAAHRRPRPAEPLPEVRPRARGPAVLDVDMATTQSGPPTRARACRPPCRSGRGSGRSAHARAGLPASLATDRPAAAGVARPGVRPRIGSVGTRAAPGPDGGQSSRASHGRQCRRWMGIRPAIRPAAARRALAARGRDRMGGIRRERRGQSTGAIRLRPPGRRCRLAGHGARASGSGAGGGRPCRWGSPPGVVTTSLVLARGGGECRCVIGGLLLCPPQAAGF